MTRQATFLAILVALLLAVGFWFLLFQPGQEELAEVETQIADVEAQQVTTQQRIVELEQVRSDAASIEAALASAASLVPSETALPATLRQLQAAADDSGLLLLNISPSTPTALTDEAAAGIDLAEITVNMTGNGSYFQFVDFLRRVEDPALVSRGVVIDNVTVTVDEYPDLTVTITARIFANVVPGPDPAAEPEPEEETDPDAEDDDVDVDVDVEVEE